VRRDIKPANVLLADDDTPVLMDFGSMGPAVVEITNMSQAQTLQVRHMFWFLTTPVLRITSN